MAKRVVKRKTVSKKAVKKTISKKVSAPSKPSILMGAKRAWKGFFFFLFLFVISVLCYVLVTVDMYKELFFLLSYGFGAISLALLIALLAYFFYTKFKFRK